MQFNPSKASYSFSSFTDDFVILRSFICNFSVLFSANSHISRNFTFFTKSCSFFAFFLTRVFFLQMISFRSIFPWSFSHFGNFPNILIITVFRVSLNWLVRIKTVIHISDRILIIDCNYNRAVFAFLKPCLINYF